MELRIGEKIAKYRKLKGYTQEQLGELVGISGQAVSKWENGGVPDTYLLPNISKILGVSIDALFGVEKKETTIRDGRNQVTYPLWVMGIYNTDAYAHLYNFTIELIPIFQRNMSEKSFLDIE